jgi:hypothetical protein
MKAATLTLQIENSLGYSADFGLFHKRNVLPGSQIKGALARCFLASGGDRGVFESVFLSSGNIFPFMFPTAVDGHPVRRAARVHAACKRGGAEHGVVSRIDDLLHPSIGKPPACAICGNDLEPTSAWEEFIGCVMQTVLWGHSAIHRDTGTIKPGAYFQEWVMEFTKKTCDPQCDYQFCGNAWMTEDSFAALKNMLAASPRVFIGKSRSRGLGWCRMGIVERKEKTATRSVPFAGKDRLITLHCETPIIELDAYLRPVASPVLSWKGARLNCVASEKAFVQIQGWNMKDGLPKQEDVAIDMGSVFVYEMPEGVTADAPSFAEWSDQLVRNGIGERRGEGFGRIQINDPFLRQNWKTGGAV